jgi:hypothetical protein
MENTLAEFRAELGAPPDADARNRMRHTVINGTLHPRPADRIRFATPTRRTVVGSVAALAVTGAVGAVVAPHLSERNRLTTQRPPGLVVDAQTGAPVILELAAQRAATAPPVSIRPGQFVYTRTEGTNTATLGSGKDMFRLLFDSWSEIWYDPEGMLAVRIRSEDSNVRPLTEADRAAAERSGQLDLGPHRRDEMIADYEAQKAKFAKTGPSTLRPTAAYLAALPTDPDRLLAALRPAIAAADESGPHQVTDAGVFAAILNLFYNADAIIPPALRATFYRVLVKLSGVERVPGEVTIGGRTGIAVAIKATNIKDRLEIVLDAKTFTFIGMRSNPGRSNETWRILVKSAIVDAVGNTG